MHQFGFIRVCAASPQVHVGNPPANAEAIIEVLKQHADADIVLLPELCLTGYTAADLFSHQTLLRAALDALHNVRSVSNELHSLIVVGLPIAVQDSVYNCAAVIQHGQLLGIVPKQFLPTYKEFYEGRWFRAADGSQPATINVGDLVVPFGIDLLFQAGDVTVGIEICEDLWTPSPPSGAMAVAGANVLLNLSASPETVGKSVWRTDMVKVQSGRCLAAYAYASAGPSESTSDLVFGAHCLIAENGTVMESSRYVGDGGPPWQDQPYAKVDVDVQKLQHERRETGSFADVRSRLPMTFRVLPFTLTSPGERSLRRRVAAHPFVPSDPQTLADRCAEVLGIQVAGLAKRVSRLPDTAPLVIGVSGGLDSTLALLAAAKACDANRWPRARIHGITMPGFGTSTQTLASATQLMQQLGITHEQVDIRRLCLQTFRSLGHQPLGIAIDDLDVQALQQQLVKVPDGQSDLVFENVQARLRTLILMSRGFVLGTGDVSEQALGWSTYNGDHMSMYNVNTSIPKTLVQFLVRYAADHLFDEAIRSTLHEIADTVISPELMPPGEDGQIRQSTEDALGPYELHDFFLYHFVRNGASPEKILWLAKQTTFDSPYEPEFIEKTLRTFVRRFFANQFKRNCVPDGPKVGSVSLSPRGDWRMPSDADPNAWLASLQE